MTNANSRNDAVNPKGLAEWFRRRAQRNPDAPALSFEGVTWSYSRFQQENEKMAAVLASVGVKPGMRVGYLGFNHPLTLVTMFAASRIGAIFIPMNFRLAGRETKQCIDDADIHTVIVDEHHQHLIEEVRSSLGCTNYISTNVSKHDGWLALDELRSAAPASVPAVNNAPDDVAILLFTSGTTGRAKGAMITHENIWLNNANWFLASDYRSHDVGMNVAPLFHAGGLNAVVVPMLLAGGHVVLQQTFDPQKFMLAIEEFGVTVTFMVPAMMLVASQHEVFSKVDLSSLRLIVAGGAPVPEPILKIFGDRGIPVSHCYGMTEATSAVSFLETSSALRKLGSCGQPGMLCDIRIVDADENEVTEPLARGEIRARGGNIIKGYWGRPEDSAAVIDADGWLRSGDIGYFDADGYLYICDRLKDMIISG
ncbi:MAG: AMP-binding protein, partial [Rhodobiaceae bacterium]|nr:AMP-binding protein [Rhodobiaceae bacterium]